MAKVHNRQSTHQKREWPPAAEVLSSPDEAPEEAARAEPALPEDVNLEFVVDEPIEAA